ncbi:MAG: ketoacyl-ACP synthase III [Ignavibacteriales bacterium]|nr:ketoacyl-ACP synthase III [Ignavibacteriales bacterium]
MKQFVKKVSIVGTGSYLPEKIYTNQYLESIVSTSDQWIQENLGIKERRIASPNQATSDLAAQAGLAAIKSAGISVNEIDLIIVATATPDRLAPSTACIVQDKLKAYNAVAFDLSAVCSGFLFGLSTAAQFIASSVYKYVLLIGADTFSRITDWSQRECVFFGDGAGAAVLTHTEGNAGFLAFKLYSDGRGKFNFTVPGGGSENPLTRENIEKKLQYFEMNGREVYNTATKVIPMAVSEVLKDANLSIDDIDFMIPHQPSIRILKETARLIGLPFEKVMTNMDRYANTSAGTIPILLDELNKSGKIKKNNIILFAAVGSGWTWGASVIKWT